MLSTKRHCDWKDDIKDTKIIEKCDLTETSTKNDGKPIVFEETLADEYQPQFQNYMLVGDIGSIMILNSKNLIHKTRLSRQVLYQNYCHSAWSVNELLSELKSKKKCYPIAKRVLLSVGYNDYCTNSSSALMLADSIDKVIQKLEKRGCKDIILTNVPPAAAFKASVEHWEYLQIINDEILRICEKYNFISHCNIFKLFCTPKNYFNQNKDYVTFREINYKVDCQLYNEHKNDGVTFNDLGKRVLGKYIEKAIQNRLEFLRYRKIDNVICSLEIDDSEDVEIVDVKKEEPLEIISLDSDEDKKKVNHIFGCQCQICKAEDQNLMEKLLSTIDDPSDDDDMEIL